MLLQVDLIDFSSCPDGDYKYLLNYQDHGTKLYDNAPLTHKTIGAVAVALLSIFSTIGPPQILQADNGACRKAKRLCNSRCHRRNVSCRNFEVGDDDL